MLQKIKTYTHTVYEFSPKRGLFTIHLQIHHAAFSQFLFLLNNNTHPLIHPTIFYQCLELDCSIIWAKAGARWSIQSYNEQYSK